MLNRTDSTVQRLLEEKPTSRYQSPSSPSQLYDLARMSVRPLEKDEITAFLRPFKQAAETSEIMVNDGGFKALHTLARAYFRHLGPCGKLRRNALPTDCQFPGYCP